jgi:hypothetical protein
MSGGRRHAPRTCPVCGEGLAVTRLSCECGTELTGSFAACEFCTLGADDLSLLRVFLASRGNLKEVERHLGVSYPTARARVDALLARLGVATAATAAPPPSRMSTLEALAAGEIDVDEALRRV